MTDDNLQLAPDEEARIERILRSMSDADLGLDVPPPSLWDDIEAKMHDEETGETPTTDNVVDLTSRFRRPPTLLIAAAAALVLIIGTIALVGSAGGSEAEVVGEAELGWQDGFVTEGTDLTVGASILADGDQEKVRLDDAALPERADEDLELWLIGVDADGELTIQTLGVIADADDPGTYDVPDSFDSDAFETVLVDISYEPRDGDEAHSGASIVRGPVVDA